MSRLADLARLFIAYPHPCFQSRPMFFLFDSVHILKCIRNNWLNLRSFDKSFVFPRFDFADITTMPRAEEYVLEFHLSLSQRQLIFDTAMCAIEAKELNSFIFKESCKNNHDSMRLAKLVLWASTNTLLNNLCFKYNEKFVQEKRTKRRKLQTVS